MVCFSSSNRQQDDYHQNSLGREWPESSFCWLQFSGPRRWIKIDVQRPVEWFIVYRWRHNGGQEDKGSRDEFKAGAGVVISSFWATGWRGTSETRAKWLSRFQWRTKNIVKPKEIISIIVQQPFLGLQIPKICLSIFVEDFIVVGVPVKLMVIGRLLPFFLRCYLYFTSKLTLQHSSVIAAPTSLIMFCISLKGGMNSLPNSMVQPCILGRDESSERRLNA